MGIRKRLGLFFGAEALSLVEMDGQVLKSQYHVPYDIISQDEPMPSAVITEEVRLTAVLQKTLRERRIEIPDCFAAIPTKDIILRSFVIPQMNPQEVTGAVEFEARKYIPFKLDELIYDFQVTKVKEAGVKKLRILFVGIRKDILKKYLYALEQSNLKVGVLEPSPISLLRILTQKKIILSTHSCAVIEVEEEQGNIIILDKGLPLFIRDFKLTSSSSALAADKMEDSSFLRLLNEVRVSLDYYRRQFPQEAFDKIIFCSERDIKAWAENLQKELNIPVVYLKPQEVLGLKEYADIGLLKAVGAAIKDYVNLPVAINLSKKRVIQIKEKRGLKPGDIQALRINSIIRWALGTAAFVFFVYLFSMRQVWDLTKQMQQLNQVKSKHSSKKSQELEGLILDDYKKISTFQQIKAKKYLTPIYMDFARLLPEGVWITNLDIRTEEDKSSSLSLKGSAYSKDTESQINLVNNYLDNLKTDPSFSQNFKKIDLNFANLAASGELSITNFEINCR